MDTELAATLATIVEQAITEGAFPGAVVLVEKSGRIAASVTRGHRQIQPSPEPMTEDTLFDLASLTKPLATAVLVLNVCWREGIDLGSPLGRFLPQACPETRAISLLQLLLHTSGLPAVPDVYTQFPDADHVDPEAAERILLSRRPLIPPDTEVVYSCTGYQLLGLLLRRVTGLRLRDFFRAAAAESCGQTDLFFCPPAEARARAATTEHCLWRRRWIRGEVHDENSWCLGGDAGNAGLFGTASAVLRWLGLFTSGGVLGGRRLLPDSRVGLMRTCLTPGLNRRRAVGFSMHDAEAVVGPLYGAESFGHTGFTGTSVWIEPAADLKVVVMTNRVHYGRTDTAAKVTAFRQRLHEAALRG